MKVLWYAFKVLTVCKYDQHNDVRFNVIDKNYIQFCERSQLMLSNNMKDETHIQHGTKGKVLFKG